MKKFTTIFLDVDNTLLDFEKCARESIKQSLETYNLQYNEHIYEVFTKVNNKLWHDREKGLLTGEQLHAIRWNMILKEVGITSVEGVLFEQTFLDTSNKIAIPVDGAVETLQYLCDKYTVCVASNSGYDRQFNRLTIAGMMNHLDFLFTSGELGFLKPNVEFFDACFEKLGNPSKSQVIMVGDSLSADILGGKNYGISTCWYNHTKIENNDPYVADYIISDIRELKSIL